MNINEQMLWQSSPHVIVLFSAGLISFVWALYGLRNYNRRGESPHILAFIGLCLAVSVWTVLYGIQLASATFEMKLLAYKLLHVGSVFVPPTWLIFALAFTGRGHWITPRSVATLFVIPVLLLVALPTNPYSLALTGVTLETRGGLVFLVTNNGPLYLLFLAYGYLVVFLGAALLAYAALHSSRSRLSAIFVLSAGVIPLVVSIAVIFGGSGLTASGVNLTPLSLAISVILLGVALTRYRLFDLMPIARTVVFENIRDGIIVLDTNGRIVDVNAAARTFLGVSDEVIGQVVPSLLPEWHQFSTSKPVTVLTTTIETEEGPYTIQLARSALPNGTDRHGWIVQIQDVTTVERQRATLERKNRRLNDFASIVSHDLRNPLTVAVGRLELAREECKSNHFDAIETAHDRMEMLIEDLLQLARNEEVQTDFELVDLATWSMNVGEPFKLMKLHS